MAKAYGWCAAAYVAALGSAIGLGIVLEGTHPIAVAALGDGLATVVVFAFSVAFKNSSFYDPYWSVAPIAIAVYWAVVAAVPEALGARQILIVALVTLWGARLTFNFLRGWPGLAHEDWRYVDIREATGRFYWPVSFLGIHLVPTIVVFLGCLSIYPGLALAATPLGLVDGVAGIVIIFAVLIEGAADRQLRRFVLENRQSGAVMRSGLWAYSRHPNYFGEILFWWGLYVFALAAGPGYWWTVVGPVSITVLFLFVSLPMMEKRHALRRPTYREETKNISICIPWFSK